MKARLKNRIREVRKEKELKQAVLAEKVGIFQSEFSEIESGLRKPNVYLAKRIARTLGVNCTSCFNGTTCARI
ncbi:MAG: helix-turn-helix transcriptional regulator [Candidatus Freyarchaeota archaeon]|nr:helix-turn-helix transcriptional regulator [Candidatus Jordarchaeia archaeon]